MKKTILIIPLIFTLFINNIFAQYVTNYNLGNGYNYFKSINKSQFIRDATATRNVTPRYMGSIESEQDVDRNSFLNLLREKNGDLAKKYNDELFKLDKEYHDVIVFISSDNEKVYRFALIWTKQLEIISDYYKDSQNVFTEMEIDQNTINESYTKTKDSIINLNRRAIDSINNHQRLKFAKEKEINSTQLNIAKQDSNKFKDQLNVIYTPIRAKYNSAINLLKKEKKEKIDQLPQTNFVQNKAAIDTKYDNLISVKVSQANLELKNAYNKYMSDHEQEISEYSRKIKELTSSINNLDNKMNNVNNNLDYSFPPKPVVNETKFQKKLNQVAETREQKLAPLRILLANLVNSSIQSNKIVPIIR